MSQSPKNRPPTGKVRLLDLALDADFDAHGFCVIVAACRRANKTGLVFMSTPRWASEANQKVATFRKRRDKFIGDRILIDVGKRRSGVRVFRIDAVRLAEFRRRPFRETADGLPGQSVNGPLNLKSESKGNAAAHQPAGFARLDFEKECGVSADVRSLLKLKFPSQKSKFDCLLYFDDPILRVVTTSAVDGIWLSEHLFAIQKVIGQAGIAISEVVVEVASRQVRDP